MEDDNGLELSLGLCCGGSSGKSKIKEASSDPKADEGGSNRLMGGNMTAADSSFKNFFQAVTGNQDLKGKQKTAPDNTQQNFWTDLGKCSTLVTDHSSDVQKNITQFSRYQELWASNSKTTDNEEEKSNKRKMPFDEINFQNKHEKVAENADTHRKIPTSVNLMRNSHASVTTEDACSGVNEDVAESEAEGSNSWLVSQHEEKSKSSDIPKFSDKYVTSESSVGQKESAVSGSESNQELGKVAYGIPLLQPLTVMTVPYPVPVKVPTNANAPNATGFSSPCALPPLPVTNSERPPVQAMNTSNLQLSFGYSPVQLPTLETGSSWAFNSLVPRHVTSIVNRNGPPDTENSEGLKASQGQLRFSNLLSSFIDHENDVMILILFNNKLFCC